MTKRWLEAVQRFFGASMASFAATTLLWRGTPLDRRGALNPVAYKQLAPMGGMVGTLFLVLTAALTAAGIGWFHHRRDPGPGRSRESPLRRLAARRISATIAGTLLLFLLRPKVKSISAGKRHHPHFDS